MSGEMPRSLYKNDSGAREKFPLTPFFHFRKSYWNISVYCLKRDMEYRPLKSESFEKTVFNDKEIC